MYIAKKEIVLGKAVYKVGDEVPVATNRMIELGMVQEVNESKKKVEVQEPEEELLIEESSAVEVQTEVVKDAEDAEISEPELKSVLSSKRKSKK